MPVGGTVTSHAQHGGYFYRLHKRPTIILKRKIDPVLYPSTVASLYDDVQNIPRKHRLLRACSNARVEAFAIAAKACLGALTPSHQKKAECHE